MLHSSKSLFPSFQCHFICSQCSNSNLVCLDVKVALCKSALAQRTKSVAQTDELPSWGHGHFAVCISAVVSCQMVQPGTLPGWEGGEGGTEQTTLNSEI